MKRYRIIIVLISTLFIVTIGCSSQLDNEDFSDMIGKGQNYTPPPVVVEGPTLKDKEGWKIDSIDGKNFIWYTYQNGAFNAQQQVNVLELDLSNPDYELEFVALPQSDSLSSVALKHDAVGGVNGTYELDASFIKTNGSIMSAITLPEGHLRYWKHEGAITYDGYKVAIVHGKPKSCGKCIDCNFYGCNDCTKKLRDWADNEYGKPPVDWSKVPVDTPIYVRYRSSDEWEKKHFAKFENNYVYAWSDGKTSWSTTNGSTMVWEHAKLAESEDQNVNKQD